ncbi:MAG: GntR family transcriptional regulator [Thermomicrobiales bacterium]|nr:GntR family transcriptional regulator [Thermomicrobiales bacterium]
MVEGSDYEPGDRIPSERELADRLGVSRVTVRRAIEDLTRLGLLERRSTSGTYVRNPSFLRDVGGPAQGLSQRLRAAGEPSSRLISFQTTSASRKIAQRLGLSLGAPVVLSRRLRLVNGQPVSLESSYLPQMRVPGLAAADLLEGSLYQILRERYGIAIGPSDDILNLSWAAPDEAELLGLPADSPVLLLRSTVADAAGQPIEYLVSVNHPERVAFHVVGDPRQ